jgi:hypothetical protein
VDTFDPDTFDTVLFLLGRWRVERRITDYRLAMVGTFLGTAVWGAASYGRGSYREFGELRFGAHTGPAERHLQYQPTGTGSVLLYFADGRPFVDLDLRSGSWQATHLCGEDRHRIGTEVRSRGEVQERWLVRGPETDYQAVTILTRAAEAPDEPERRVTIDSMPRRVC